MTTRDLAIVATIGLIAWLWLSYVIMYRRGRDEVIARLLMNGTRGLRERLMTEEGISDGR